VTTPDLINGFFETCGGIMLLLHCRRLYQDKEVKGSSPWAATFFMSWGYWNLYFYPHLGAWASFFGGILVVAVNTLWVGMMTYYIRYPLPDPRSHHMIAAEIVLPAFDPRNNCYLFADGSKVRPSTDYPGKFYAVFTDGHPRMVEDAGGLTQTLLYHNTAEEAAADLASAEQGPAAGRLKLVHYGMGSDLMAYCGQMEGISGHDQVRLSYVDGQVTCVPCLRKRIQELKAKDG
jgi:hypothetical protein